jgi:hypothetical protein
VHNRGIRMQCSVRAASNRCERSACFAKLLQDRYISFFPFWRGETQKWREKSRGRRCGGVVRDLLYCRVYQVCQCLRTYPNRRGRFCVLAYVSVGSCVLECACVCFFLVVCASVHLRMLVFACVCLRLLVVTCLCRLVYICVYFFVLMHVCGSS